MSESLSKALSKVQHSATRLNQLTDQANNTVREVENFLNDKCKVGIPAYIDISKSDDLAGNITGLQYFEVGIRYRISIVSGPKGGSRRAKPWSDCSREEKLETIGKIPDLIAELGKRIDEKILKAEKGLDEIAEVLQAFSERED